MRYYSRFTACSFGLLFCLFVFFACTPLPPADYYEVDGIVSIDASQATESANWKLTHYLNSKGIVSNIQEPDSSLNLTFSFYLTNPGSYSFWILTAGNKSDEEDDETNGVDVLVSGPDGFLVDQFQLILPSDERLQWANKKSANDEQVMLNFSERGEYTIRLNSRGMDGIQIHKIQMSYNDYMKPTGLGLPASVSPEINAAVLFREQPVMLPPDWTFGLVSGSVGQRNDDLSDINSLDLKTNTIKPDAYWTKVRTTAEAENVLNQLGTVDIVPGFEIENRLTENLSSDSSIQNLFEPGYTFSVIRGEISPDQTEILFSSQLAASEEHERGVIFRDIHHAYDPISKQIPAMMTQPATPEWNSIAELQNNTFIPGGLDGLLDTFTNPKLSTYNIPFISIPIVLKGNTVSELLESEELFIRKMQIASFMPVMHLLHDRSGEQIFSSLTEQKFETLRSYSELRSKLFPYIYTHAHITRQTGQSLIGGFREHEKQYRFGDAFLVAPVTEPGVRERSIYFPGEGNWYDYHTGRSYSAGQSWIVEAPLHRLPLFVKAGSVIPFRPEAGQIRSGSNDHLLVEIYTGDAGTFRLTEDDGISRDYRRARAARTMFRYNEVAGQLRLTIGAVQSNFDGMNDLRTYDLHFKHMERPQEVMVNDIIIEEVSNTAGEDNKNQYWIYDNETSNLIIKLIDQWKHERTEITITP